MHLTEQLYSLHDFYLEKTAPRVEEQKVSTTKIHKQINKNTQKQLRQTILPKYVYITLGGLNGYVSGIFISSWYLPPSKDKNKSEIKPEY